MLDWPLLQTAITAKVDEQEEFVRWWDETVGVRLRSGGADRALNADRRSMVSKATAEADTGISQQQVSRWSMKFETPKNKDYMYVA